MGRQGDTVCVPRLPLPRSFTRNEMFECVCQEKDDLRFLSEALMSLLTDGASGQEVIAAPRRPLPRKSLRQLMSVWWRRNTVDQHSEGD